MSEPEEGAWMEGGQTTNFTYLDTFREVSSVVKAKVSESKKRLGCLAKKVNLNRILVVMTRFGKLAVLPKWIAWVPLTGSYEIPSRTPISLLYWSDWINLHWILDISSPPEPSKN